ncbi:MAG: LLM class flavin-dependent oxidoreductase [Myxococcota bacterium]|nr:LLM class flavin-dependent oxidoreductase [Myxococcota bacterium]
MKIAIRIGGPTSGGREHFDSMLELAVEAEKLGVDQAWSAEAWGMDAIVPLAYLAARTTRLKLGTGIMQVCARTPASVAMTALAMDTATEGRFLLGLGNSGPQVVEGLHGQSFDRPLTRMRETVEIIRLAARGEKLEYDGSAFSLPRKGGQGKALKLAQPPASIPIYLATLAPRALEMTGALADGWLGTCFVPDEPEAHLAFLRKGAESAGRTLEDLTLCVDATLAITDQPEQVYPLAKAQLAFQLSAMGSPTMNFYNDAYARGGFSEACQEVRNLWLEKRRDDAIAAVPDEMIEKTMIIGDESHVRSRIKQYREAGITDLMLHPVAPTTEGKLNVLGRAIELAQEG